MTALRARSAWTAALAAHAAVVAWTGTAVALAVAPGVTLLGGDTYDTEFIDGPLYLVAALLSLGLGTLITWLGRRGPTVSGAAGR